MEAKNKGKKEGGEAGITKEKPLKKMEKEAVIPDPKTEKRGGEEAGFSQEKPVIKGAKEVSGIDVKTKIKGKKEEIISEQETEKRAAESDRSSPEKPVTKGKKNAVISEVNDTVISQEEPVKKSGNADAVIVFRLHKNLKENLKAEAKSRGITLTELILSRVKGSKVRDRKNEEKIIAVISEFTREFNKTGNNINQIAVAIHQIKNEHRIESGQFAEISNALNAYNDRIDFLRSSILKIESDDI